MVPAHGLPSNTRLPPTERFLSIAFCRNSDTRAQSHKRLCIKKFVPCPTLVETRMKITTRLIMIVPFITFILLAPAQEPPMKTQGITEKVLTTVDLGPEIEGMAGRKLRMRLITIEPGGATAIHNHIGRPGTVYILEGKITDHREGVAKEYGPGLGWPEDSATTHWIENKGTSPAVEISVDIIKQP